MRKVAREGALRDLQLPLPAAQQPTYPDPERVDQVTVGNILSAGQGMNPGRQVGVKSGVPVTAPGIWDRFGVWTVMAVALVALAYAYPLLHLLSMPRYGSPGFQPF